MIRYDAPGAGLSASDGEEPDSTLEGEAAVLGAVIAASGAEAVDLSAGSSGSPVGLAFAAAHPGAVRRIAVYGATLPAARSPTSAPGRR